MPSDFAGFQCHAIQNRSKKKSKLVSRLHNFWLLYCRITSGFFQYCYVLAAYCPLHSFRFDLREKKIRTFLVARFNFKLSCLTNPPFTNPCFTNPCFTNPPFTNPCFTNPLHVLQIHSIFYNMPENKKCPAFGKECSVCHKPNHFAFVCKTKQIGSNVHFLADDHETAMDYELIQP